MSLWKAAVPDCFGGLLTSHSIILFILKLQLPTACAVPTVLSAPRKFSHLLVLGSQEFCIYRVMLQCCCVWEWCFVCHAVSTQEANPEHTGREKAGEKTVVEVQVGSELPMFTGWQLFFQEKAFSNIIHGVGEGNWNICISISMILFCAFLPVQWCSFKDGDLNTGICFGGQLKCVCFYRSLPKFWIQYPLKPLALLFARVDCSCSRSGISGGWCCSSKLLGSCWANCFNTAVFPQCLKCFFLISSLICKYTGLRTVHIYIYKTELAYQRQKS